MNASNRVLAGEMKDWIVYYSRLHKCVGLRPYLGSEQCCLFNKENVRNIEITNKDSSPSASSTFLKSAVGGFFGGTAGMLAGASSAERNVVYTVVVYWNDNTKSLIEMSGDFYKQIQMDLF